MPKPNPLRVLLTGANGFIGSYIAAALLRDGYGLVAAVRNPAKFLQRFPTAQAIAADFNVDITPELWSPRLENVDAVINCAGILQSRLGQSASRIHAQGPAALFNAAAQIGIQKIIQISAISVAADTEYARTKLMADDNLQKLDVNWTILRPSIVYGQQAFGGTAMLRALASCPFAIPVISDGRQIATPIHIEDLCRTILLCLGSSALNRKIICPCGPQNVEMRAMLPLYRRWLGLEDAPLIHVPANLVAVAGKLGDWFGSGPITTTSIKQLAHGNACDPAAFTAATGIIPITMETALQREPASTAELWHARLYLLKPLVRVSLIFLWFMSGLAGLLAPPAIILQNLSGLGLPEELAITIGRAASLIDIGIAFLLLINPWPKQAFWLQISVISIYTALLTVISPFLWLDHFGALVKNVPALVLVALQRILDEER